jgi:hypothetical protein
MNQQRPSRLPRPRSSHLIEEVVNRTPGVERRPYLVDGMASGGPLAQENALLPELEFHRSSGDQPQPLAYLDRHGNLAFGRDGASHGVKNISLYPGGSNSRRASTSSVKNKAPWGCQGAFEEYFPATTYSPTHLRMQYHRR